MWTIAKIKKSITVVSITNAFKDRKKIARAFSTKSMSSGSITEVKIYTNYC